MSSRLLRLYVGSHHFGMYGSLLCGHLLSRRNNQSHCVRGRCCADERCFPLAFVGCLQAHLQWWLRWSISGHHMLHRFWSVFCHPHVLCLRWYDGTFGQHRFCFLPRWRYQHQSSLRCRVLGRSSRHYQEHCVLQWHLRRRVLLSVGLNLCSSVYLRGCGILLPHGICCPHCCTRWLLHNAHHSGRESTHLHNVLPFPSPVQGWCHPSRRGLWTRVC